MEERRCSICGETYKVFFYKRKIMLCERHYAQKKREDKRKIRKSIKVEDLDNEIWKDIKGYEGLYQISNLGRVKSLAKLYQGERLMKLREDKDGYLYVGFYKDEVKKYFRVHRLVAQAFIPNPLNLPLVNHKNEDKHKNQVDNLEWCTAEYNNTYNGRAKRVGEKNRGRKNSKESIERIKIAARNRKRRD